MADVAGGSYRGRVGTMVFTPEELLERIEDAVLMRDGAALTMLLDPRVVVVTAAGERRGAPAVADLLSTGRFVGAYRRVVQAGDVAVLSGDGWIRVSHRDAHGSWRLAISLPDDYHDREEPR